MPMCAILPTTLERSRKMDTMEISEKLKKAGVAEPQAQAVTSAIQEGVHEAEEYADDAVEEAQKMLVTRAELLNGISKLGREIAALREDNAKLRLEIAKHEALWGWRTVTAMVALTAIFGAIVKVF